MTRGISPAFQTALNTRTTTVCQAWKVVRQDGTVMGFTDHDEAVIFGGVTYAALTSFTASAIEDQLGLAVSNVDVLGALSSDAITNIDLESGFYDNAKVTIYAVNWKDPEAQHLALVAGTIGQVQIGDLAFQAELRSLSQHFAQYFGSLCGPKCRVANLGDTGSGLEGGCNFVMPDPVPGTIVDVTNRVEFQLTAAGSFPDGTKGSLGGGYFAYGTAKGLTGDNAGITREVFFSDPDLHIQTFEPFPNDIQIGDTFEMQIGCDKLPETCRINYDNLVNFRGEPYVPGSDIVFRVNGE